MKMLKSACAAASIIAGITSASPVLAKSTGRQFLGDSATAMNIWFVRCPSGTLSATATVEDLAAVLNPAWLRLALVKRLRGSQGAGTALTQDLTEGGVASPRAVVFNSSEYFFHVYKIRPRTFPTGPEAYQANIVCNTLNGPIDPITLTKTQDR